MFTNRDDAIFKICIHFSWSLTRVCVCFQVPGVIPNPCVGIARDHPVPPPRWAHRPRARLHAMKIRTQCRRAHSRGRHRRDSGCPRLRSCGHASPSDLQRLLAQLESEGSSLLPSLLQGWPAEQHDALTLSLTWLAKLGCIHWSDSTQTL